VRVAERKVVGRGRKKVVAVEREGQEERESRKERRENETAKIEKGVSTKKLVSRRC
jgi:hypothetical protein